jgi:HlyD family secretion protein/Biotin-lipoyl like
MSSPAPLQSPEALTSKITLNGPAISSASVLSTAEPANAGLQFILQIERDARRAPTIPELRFLIANETRRVVGARQVFLLQPEGKKYHVTAISSLTGVDRQSPLVQWIEKRCTELVLNGQIQSFPMHNLKAGQNSGTQAIDDAAKVFPFPQALITRIVDRQDQEIAILVSVRETGFSESDCLLQKRLSETYAHAWAALGGLKKAFTSRLRSPIIWAAMIGVTGCIGLLPVPMSALAPAEVSPLEPIIIAAPIDGSIDQVLVEPNRMVKAGDTLFRYVDTQAKGALDVADREVAVAEAKLRQASQMAFVDPSAKRELAISRTELRLKKAEQAFAAEIFERTIVRAPKEGIAVFADKRELIGRPVNTGQRIMELADPARTLFKLQVPADDALVLGIGAKVRVFMDADPLNPIAAKVTRAAPMAKPGESGNLTFRTEAMLVGGAIMPPLGHRGTAQISGEQVTLAFYLFRRPIAALRQRTGL